MSDWQGKNVEIKFVEDGIELPGPYYGVAPKLENGFRSDTLVSAVIYLSEIGGGV